MVAEKRNLKALSQKELEFFIRDSGLPLYRAKQLIHWIYEKHAQSIQDITEFSIKLRAKLSEMAYIGGITIVNRQASEDGTEKFLLGLHDGESIESVLLPEGNRLTLCISSQVGCAMNCGFCLTGTLGFKRNLEAHEIVDQILTVSRIIEPAKLTNIVFMGMGEPLANFDEVVEALWRITAYMKISPKRITLSTAGIVPKILELPHKAPPVNLAISLNAATDAVRDAIMPINKTYPLRALLAACRRFPLKHRRRITFEYVLLQGVNDSIEDAQRLLSLLRTIPSKVNLIPLNSCEGSAFRRPDDETVLRFQEVLLKGGLTAFIRKSKGQAILAACGQLKAGYR
ncbi:MAG TPA: 23S rRNA (adenine(2503)-C(2))-methyltransferase RlmN [Nitrospiraceae bacterium]|jgi:23S rRNA (adenine2503-C2)-methyltransferase|nr:23S rRNA (adenine(2503)-C(2))-methyltransferase RlmN [Nitrospiraceae bacterium]